MVFDTQDKYKRFFELSLDMFCIANKDGYFIEVNHSFSKVLGYSKNELLSQPFLSFIHPKDIERTKREIEKNNQGMKTHNFENRYRHKNGQYLSFIWNAQFDTDSDVIFAVAHNVTEQRNQAHKLSQIEKTLYTETILAETDARGVITDINTKFCEVSGYSKQELIGKTHKVVNSGYHSKDFFTSLWKTISSNKVWSGIIKNKKKNGDFYYVQTIISPITDLEGNILSYLAIRQDITESVRHESDLAKTLEILNETGSIAKVGGWELDIKTGELSWTDETFRILEFEKRASQKPSLPDGLQLFTPKHQPLIENAVNRAIQLGESYSLELQALTGKGNIIWVYTNGQAKYEDGEVVSLSGTIQNIDAKKKVEEKLNIERQQSIQNAKLASLGELAASMAHEINNPLGIISGYTELMLLSPDITGNLSSKLEILQKSCERISHIVNNLKKFSRVNNRASRSEETLVTIVEEAISLANPRLKREIVKLQFSGDLSARIYCNSIEIEQVFLNLINNAIDAVKNQSKKWISISLIDTNEYVECRISDSGDGIPRELQEKVFSPFFSSKQIGEGTGLGLSIVDGIMKDHHASIYYDNKALGSCFVLTFPKATEN